MRLASRIAVLGIALTLGACATAGQQPATAPATPQPVAANSEIGNYLAARFAATEHNLTDAAHYYRQALNQDPNNPTILALAFFFATSSVTTLSFDTNGAS